MKDLFGDIMEDAAKALDDEEGPARGSEEKADNTDLDVGGSLYQRPVEKSYTLTIISDPE